MLTRLTLAAHDIFYGCCAHLPGEDLLKEATAVTKANVCGGDLHVFVACVKCSLHLVLRFKTRNLVLVGLFKDFGRVWEGRVQLISYYEMTRLKYNVNLYLVKSSNFDRP